MFRTTTAVLPVKLEGDTAHPLPLTFHHTPSALATSTGTNSQRNSLNSLPLASPEEMRGILDLLNDDEDSKSAKPSARGARNKSAHSSTAAAHDDAAEKRRKHREAMVLFRLKKKVNFKDMKKQELQLQDVLQLKLQQFRERRDAKKNKQQHQQHAEEEEEEEDDSTMRNLLDTFADVLTLKESLVRENRAMEGVISELAKFHKLVQDDFERQQEEDAASAAAASTSALLPPPLGTGSPVQSPTSSTSHPEATGKWVQFFDHESPFYYEFVSKETCATLVHDGFQQVMQLRDGFCNREFDISETFCLGWQTQRALGMTATGKSVVRFRFLRSVPSWFMTLDELRKAAWPAVTIPAINARLYSTPVYMKVLQFIDDNSFVTVRNTPLKDRGVHIRYFAFNTRLEYVDAQKRRCFIIFHTILKRQPLSTTPPPPAATAPAASMNEPPPVVWIKDGVLSMLFTEDRETKAVEIEYSGYMQCVNEEQARYLMIETCNVLMRWEQLVVPPRLLRSD